MYAQLPVFKYQTYDRESLTFSEHPIIPPSPRKRREFCEDADADEQPKNDDAPVHLPADHEPSDPPIDIINLPADAPADAPADGRRTVKPSRIFQHL